MKLKRRSKWVVPGLLTQHVLSTTECPAAALPRCPIDAVLLPHGRRVTKNGPVLCSLGPWRSPARPYFLPAAALSKASRVKSSPAEAATVRTSSQSFL